MLTPDHLHSYNAVRNNAGSWIREEAALIKVSGADRFTWLQGMISNDTTLLSSRSVTRLNACVLDATGHLLADVVLTCPPGDADFLLMETPAHRRDAVIEWLDRYLITEEVELKPLDLVTVTIQGPSAGGISADLFGKNGHAYYSADHTGSGGYDCYSPPGEIQHILQQAADQGAIAITELVQELLRIEAGIPSYGPDMDSSVIALEAGLGKTHISLTKGCYVGQEIIARIDSRGHTNRQLTGLVFADGICPAPGDTLFPAPTEAEPEPRETGRVCSVAPCSPAMDNRPIALAYVRHESRIPETALKASSGAEAAVIELPFFRG